MNVAVVGLGKLGLCMAALYAVNGNAVLGIDMNENLIKSLNEESFETQEPGLQDLLDKSKDSLSFNINYEDVDACEVICIIVPTPSRTDGTFSTDYIEAALEEIAWKLEKSAQTPTIVLCSTVMPGDCEILQRKFNTWSQRTDIGIVYSPEFIALGAVIHGLQSPDLVLIGANCTKDSYKASELLLSVIESEPIISICTPTEAEITKIAINTYITMKISFANTIGELCSSVGADSETVLSSVGADSRIGQKYLRSGMPYGGPCFPRDTKAFSTWAWQQNVPPVLARGSDILNSRRKFFLLTLAQDAGGPYAVIGLSYRPNTSVIDESLTVWLAEKLQHNSKTYIWDDADTVNNTLTVLNDCIFKNLFDIPERAKTIILGDVELHVRQYVLSYMKDHPEKNILDIWNV